MNIWMSTCLYDGGEELLVFGLKFGAGRRMACVRCLGAAIFGGWRVWSARALSRSLLPRPGNTRVSLFSSMTLPSLGVAFGTVEGPVGLKTSGH